MDDARMDDARIAQADGGVALSPASGLTPTVKRDVMGPGRFAFRKAIERDAECGTLRMSGMIVAELEGIGPSLRGRLGDALDDAIERELTARGAAAPGLTSSSDRDAALSDQLFRARRVGAPGIAIVLGPLRAAAGPLGALEPEDCATLRFLAGATRERPVTVLLDERDARTGGYADPVPLGELLVAEPFDAPPASTPAPVWQLARTPEPEPLHAHRHAPELLLPSEPVPAHPHAPELALPSEPVHAPLHAPELALASEPAWEPAPVFADAPVRAFEPTPVPSPALSLARHMAGANVVDREEAWRAWTLQLVAARGPQPLAALERLFTDSYMPLANAIGAGLDDARARSAHDEFRSSFAKSYSEAFPTFAATTKRPRMVLDVHDSAGRIARLHGARSTRMLLVDAMRWDVSRLVQERLAARLGERAAMTDELVLWSALPSTTMRQLETIARGVEALRSPGEMDADAEPPRGRTAEYVRRLRVGPREVHKLDVVESRLQGARGGVLRAIPEIAEATAEAIARHAETLAPNTLLFVFGDHGFTIDRTGTARQGGASPEEVLVGAFALLVGDVH
jgi:hypothetical protein